MSDNGIPVVLVHWNQPDACLRTVDAFRSQEPVGRIVIVDNGSRRDVIEQLEAAITCRSGVDLVRLGTNSGFGPAANRGFELLLRETEAEWIALAPHDALPDPMAMAEALAILDNRPAAGLASADVGDASTPVIDPYFGSILAPAAVEYGWEPADHPHGTLLFARRGCLLDVGTFDERYFAYCEEADLALRARARGWEVGLLRGVGVTNPNLASTTALVDYLQHRNTLLLVRDHSGRYHAFIRFATALLQLAIGLVSPSRRPLVWDASARCRALFDFGRGRFGPPPAGVLPGPAI